MIGQLVLRARGQGRAEMGRLYGLKVLRAETDPAGFWGPRRLRKAGKSLRLGGALRVLVPREFADWTLLNSFGLRPVEPDPLVRALSAPLALKALDRQGVAPDRATVALRGLRADRDMLRTAVQLCPKVRRLVVDAPQGGRELAAWLRKEFGIPILPEGEAGQVALGFHPDAARQEGAQVELYGVAPDLAGLTLSAPGLAEEDRADLPLMTALWEGGRLGWEDIKIT